MPPSAPPPASFSLDQLIDASPAVVDHIRPSRAFVTARAELDKRKREVFNKEREGGFFPADLAGPAFVKQRTGTVDVEPKRYLTSYRVPSYFTKVGPRRYEAKLWKLLSLDVINVLKAHSIEHLICVDAGLIPLPSWWEKTGMTFHQFTEKGAALDACAEKLLEANPDSLILVATS